MNQEVGNDPARTRHPESLFGRLASLTEALGVVDATDPKAQPVAFTTATFRLVAAVREVVTAAAPLLEDHVTLTTALRDAADDRRDLPDWCRYCSGAFDKLCAGHEADLAMAEEYDGLHRVLFGKPPAGS